MKEILIEAPREIPVAYSTDVIVCGAGPAGVCAAIAAARSGARTLLLERGGCLGGIWTGGLLSWIIDSSGKDGIIGEIIGALEQDGSGQRGRSGHFIAQPERVKQLLERMCRESGVELLLYTQLAGAVTGGGRITHVLTESKSGRQAAAAKVFIDATGDGDLGYYAGCRYEYGKPGSGHTQPMSLIALIDGLDPEEARSYNNTLPYDGSPNPKDALLEVLNRAGTPPSYDNPTLLHIQDGLWIMMTNHEYGRNPFDAASLTEATTRSREELHDQVNALRKLGGVWSRLRIVQTAPFIGVREGRRIRGKYTVTIEDALNGARFDDAVCRVHFGLDVHPVQRSSTFAAEHGGMKAKPYDIPLRALMAADMDNLLMAGRCLSGDFLAHSSYRVTGVAAATGEAAGRHAAQLSRSKAQLSLHAPDEVLPTE
ncbi:MAG: FAD-dependent oxidoreductase [Paenibacillaceae bacterium]|nr:FAD-dependent oxidoreductase [Paenibacillaceae bacterium]